MLKSKCMVIQTRQADEKYTLQQEVHQKEIPYCKICKHWYATNINVTTKSD